MSDQPEPPSHHDQGNESPNEDEDRVYYEEFDLYDVPPDHRSWKIMIIIGGIFAGLGGLGIMALGVIYGTVFPMIFRTSGVLGGTGMDDVRILGMSLQNLFIFAGVTLALAGLIGCILAYGSLRLRRWCRALGLFVGWTGIYYALLNIPYAFVQIKMMDVMEESMNAAGGAGASPAGFNTGLVGVTTIVTVIVMLIFPVFQVFAYIGRHAKNTVEIADRKSRWTDHCPIPVLGMVIGFGLTAIFSIPSLFLQFPYPLFGKVVDVTTSRYILIGLILIIAYVAFGAYKLHKLAWVLSIALVIASVASWMVSADKIDWISYIKMCAEGPDDMFTEMEETGMMEFLSDPIWTYMTLLSALPILGYLGYLAKFFFGKSWKTAEE